MADERWLERALAWCQKHSVTVLFYPSGVVLLLNPGLRGEGNTFSQAYEDLRKRPVPEDASAVEVRRAP